MTDKAWMDRLRNELRQAGVPEELIETQDKDDSPFDENFFNTAVGIVNQVKYETGAGLCQRACRLVNAGELQQALALFRQAVAVEPTYAFAWSDLGRCLLDLDQPADAVPILIRATELAPSDLATWYSLGEAHARQNQFGDAFRCLERCKELPKSDSLAQKLAKFIDDAARRHEEERRGRPVATLLRPGVEASAQAREFAYSALQRTLGKARHQATEHFRAQDFESAETMQRNLIDECTRILGSDDVLTFAVRADRLFTLLSLDRRAEASQLAYALSDDGVRVFGEQHAFAARLSLHALSVLMYTNPFPATLEFMQSRLLWLYFADPATLDPDLAEVRAELLKIMGQSA